MTTEEYEFISLTNIPEAIKWLGDKFVRKIVIEGDDVGVIVSTSRGETNVFFGYLLLKSQEGNLAVVNKYNIGNFLTQFEYIKGTCKGVY